MWSPEQERALAAVKDWLTNSDQQVFRLFGYAGTGKTTLAKALAEDAGEVLFAAFTGKAAHVLQTKGCPASTIHSLIYQVREKSMAAVRIAEQRLAKRLQELDPKDVDKDAEVIQLRKILSDEAENANQPFFKLNLDSPVRDADLVIIDECSMVDGRMGEDLLSFGTKVLVLGDPAQLPPVMGEGFFTNAKPDVMLTEIHRQAKGNPIIDLATMIRTFQRPKVGTYGSSVVMPKEELNKEIAMAADQIIVGRNKTRHGYNARLRQLHGYEGLLPNPGERVICLRNNHEVGLLNGSIWDVTAALELDTDRIVMDLINEDGQTQNVEAHTHYFQGREKDLSPFLKREAEEFTYGYAITCHKSQGSQWNSVLVLDEGWCFRDDRWKWLYTAVTRAANRVVIAYT